MKNFFPMPVLAAVALFAALGLTATANASPITWTQWDPTSSPGNPGTATGTMGGITVTYSGQLNGVQTGYPSWTPTSSFSGGTVDNAPPAANNAVSMQGGYSFMETITFSSAVTNPVFAIWSLGSGGNAAVYNFTSPFTIQAGGPSIEYAGQSITSSGQTVYGAEGNGVIQFTGTFNSISFTTPQSEFYYDFTVGAPATPPVPEPSSLALLGTGLLGVVGAIRRKAQQA